MGELLVEELRCGLTRIGDRATATLAGVLDATATPALEALAARLSADEAIRSVRLDMTDVRRIEVEGWGPLADFVASCGHAVVVTGLGAVREPARW
jgi:anti-anti-sigma regulatory factor